MRAYPRLGNGRWRCCRGDRALYLYQSARNEALTSLLAKCPVPVDVPGLETTRTTLMDRRGEGVAILLDRSETLSGRRPIYELIDDSELRLTIFAASALAGG